MMLILKLCLIVLCLNIFGCGHREVKQNRSTSPSQQTSSNEVMGPPLPPATTENTQGVMGPEPLPGPLTPEDIKTPSSEGYVLILGPGLARTMAFLGVLKEFEAKRIKINAIIGVEMGAVVAALYATRGINGLEWYLTNIDHKTFLDFPILGFTEKIARGNLLHKFLESAFKGKTFKDAKIPLYVSTTDMQNGQTILENQGSLPLILRAAAAVPGLIKPITFNGSLRGASTLTDPYPVKFARSLELGKIIAIDVLGKGANFSPKGDTEENLEKIMKNAAETARGLLSDADNVIYIKTDGISYLDFNARADLAYHGKTSAVNWRQKEINGENSK